MNWMASRQPVLEPDLLWERNAVCYPCVIWDEKEDLFKMWYSAGDIEKPLAIGYAVSRDGEHWEKPYSEPVLKKATVYWKKESGRVPCASGRRTVCDVLHCLAGCL